MSKTGKVYYVHCVDAEGPLSEDLNATFGRVEEVCGVKIEPTFENLNKLKEKEIDLKGKEEAVQDFVRDDQLKFQRDMAALNRTLDSVMNDEFRGKHKDSSGRSYVFNWFCLDHVGFVNNPRQRILGFHKIHDLYSAKIVKHRSLHDRLYWHYHPRPFNLHCHRFGMNHSFSNLHNEILARRIIDRTWFPVSNRPGAHMERVDFNLWLEQWIPFDLANQNMKYNEKLEMHEKIHRIPGRMGDWRGAPTDWRVYHPSYLDVRQEGDLKRHIARCLNINARQGQITENEVNNAFIEADHGNNVLLSVTNHDFRDLKAETLWIMDMFTNVAEKHRNIQFRWSNAVEAFRSVLEMPKATPVEFKFDLLKDRFIIRSSKPVWGIQPFLALKTQDANYYHDNLIIDSETQWTYPLDVHTFSVNDLACVGFAANDAIGNTTVVIYDNLADLSKCRKQYYNTDDWLT